MNNTHITHILLLLYITHITYFTHIFFFLVNKQIENVQRVKSKAVSSFFDLKSLVMEKIGVRIFSFDLWILGGHFEFSI